MSSDSGRIQNKMAGRVKYVIQNQWFRSKGRILESLLNREGVIQNAGVGAKAESVLQGWPPVMWPLDSGH